MSGNNKKKVLKLMEGTCFVSGHYTDFRKEPVLKGIFG